jgi:hypothetical protein
LDVSYSKTHLDTLANLWVEEPAPGSATIISVPGYVSQYISNIHTVSIMARTSLKNRVTLYAGYNISRDTGDGRSVQDLGIQDPAAEFLAARQTFPLTYQAPLARLSFRITPKLQWNGGWEFYRYYQQFAFYGYQPYYRAQTGYTSLPTRSDLVASICCRPERGNRSGVSQPTHLHLLTPPSPDSRPQKRAAHIRARFNA